MTNSRANDYPLSPPPFIIQLNKSNRGKRKMMKINRAFGVMRVVVLSVVAGITTPAMAEDEDGCWSGRHSAGPCLEYSTYVKNNKTYIELTNRCDSRLYMKWCANDKCGADGLRGGQTKKKYEYITGARTMAKAIGSNNPQSDWVCAGKVSNWHDR